MGGKRLRRTAEEARRVILDAAEKRLAVAGPAGIRLQEVAADVGISHPAVLHHFGSREALVSAVIDRAANKIRTEFLAAVEEGAGSGAMAEVITRMFTIYGDGGHARLLAWLILSTDRASSDELMGNDQVLERMSEAVNVLRNPDASKGVDPDALHEDSTFTVLLGALALFGEAVAGSVMRRSAGLHSDQDATNRFRQWLARLLIDHIDNDRIA